MTEPQDYLGLDAAGFLLVALGHLVEAQMRLNKEPPSEGVYHARWYTIGAANFVRHALAKLEQLNEETCES